MGDKLQLEAFKLLIVEKLKQIDNIVAVYSSEGIDSLDTLNNLFDSLDNITKDVRILDADICTLETKLPPKQVFTADDIPF